MTTPPTPLSHAEALDLAPLYVLGALGDAEMAAVREHLATCPESHAEFEELGGVVPYLLESPDIELVEPPAALGDRIMAAAAEDLAERTAAERTTPAPAAERTTPAAERTAPIPFPSADERTARAERTRGRPGPLTWIAAIAAVLAIAVLGAWNVRLQGQVNDLEQQATAAEQYRTAVTAVLDVAAQPGSQTALLAPQAAGGPRGIASVASDGSVQFAMQDLAPTTGNQVYETWAIPPGSNPVPLGSFTVDASGVASFTTKQGPVAPGMAVAVSREPQTGATAPTEVVSVGVTSTPAS
jgi:anti-sigma factor RsiW